MSGVNIEYTRKSDTETRLQELKLLQIDPFNGKTTLSNEYKIEK